MNMLRPSCIVLFAFMSICGGRLSHASPGNPEASDQTVLLIAYLRYTLAQNVERQMKELQSRISPSALPKESCRNIERWTATTKERIRDDLQERFSESARDEFQSFVARFTTAESKNDTEYLSTLSDACAVTEPAPATYADLRMVFLDAVLKNEVEEAGRCLAEIELLADNTTSGANARPSRVARLADAEAPLGKLDGKDVEDWKNPMDAVSEQREERRRRASEEAKAAMKLTAAERAAAEKEDADKRLAEATADAEAVKRHAERLASVDKEALEQSQRSWSNRLKSIVGATISAATGAFTGGVGTRAGQAAAAELFNH